ncbi:hypothetical protein AV553_20885 [Salmonella enterica]|uniref:hypothetical protein n=1 Tax=Citrobacter sedlakii TaxID=67826 RepID=UPI0012C82B9A|nr:hypothetical protein [Citrobacter sedlakii]EAS2833382.1 hypothetical protein [Salmonella enterica]ECC8734504.1 hypothetical protein [Salmonella bongori]MCZ4675969.1 hypothetical protein [Citrobacter sedlakii]MDR5006024.1 hypothetical protein [Citrobacter sedlakii]
MDIKEIRRRRLKEWFENRTVPQKESSYISQLIGGRASFGEKAARRLEGTYEMPELYLDEPYEEEPVSGSYFDLDFRQIKLLELAKSLPDSEVDDIIRQMEEKKRFYDQRVEEYFAKFGIKKP